MSGSTGTRAILAFAALLALLLVAALAALVPWRRGEPASSSGTAARPGHGAGAEPNADDGAAAEPAAPSPAGARLPVDGEAAAPLDGPRLRVVDGGTEQPMAGVAVLVLRGEDAPRSASWDPGRAQAALLAAGRRLRADGGGELRLPAFERDLWVCGASGERGLARLVGSGPFTLLLVPAHSLRLEVRDAAGEPRGGVPVALAVQLPERGWCRLRSSTTGAAGQAAIEDAGDFAVIARHGGGEALVVLDLPLREPVAKSISASLPRPSLLVLPLPPTGQVRIVLEPVAPSLLRELAVTLGCAATPATAAEARPEWIAADGTVAFPFVGLGLQLEAVVRLPGGVAVNATFAGPRTAGETVDVPLRLDAAHRLVAATLRDEAGQAVAEAWVRVREQDAAGRSASSSLSLRTQEGALCFPVPDGDGRALVARSVEFSEQWGGGAAEVPLPLRLDSGVHDLGVVTLRRLPLVAGGQVVDEAGEAVADARVTLSRQGEGKAWVETGLPTAKTNGQGRFEVRGHAEPRAHALTAGGAGFLRRRDMPFATGAGDLRVVLGRAGALTGRLLLDEGIEPSLLQVSAADAAAEKTHPLYERTRFTIAPLEPGPVHVRVAAHTVGVVYQADVVVPPGEPADLGDIDLRGTLHRIAFTVVEGDGRPIDLAWALAASEQERWEGVWLEQGTGCVLSRSPAVALVVRAQGPRCASFQGVGDGARLVMPPPAELVVTVPQDAVEALRDGESLVVGLVADRQGEDGDERAVVVRSKDGATQTWTRNDTPWPEPHQARFERGIARLPVPGPEAFRLGVSLEVADGGMAPLIPDRQTPRVRFAVPFAPEAVHVPLAPEWVAQGRALLRQARGR